MIEIVAIVAIAAIAIVAIVFGRRFRIRWRRLDLEVAPRNDVPSTPSSSRKRAGDGRR